MIVVANTSPICYLVCIGCADLLPHLFGRVFIPQAVLEELMVAGAPTTLQSWISQPPEWLVIEAVIVKPDPEMERLHKGEQEAILLAEQLKADLIVLDEKAARQSATERGLNVTGLLGILDEAATRGLINDLTTVVERLQQTTFRVSPSLLKLILDKHSGIV